jgi:hypothetical protein
MPYYLAILTGQMGQVYQGSRGFISIPHFRAEYDCPLSTNWFRKQAEQAGLEVFKHGRYGWCIGRPLSQPRTTVAGSLTDLLAQGEG